MRLSRPIKVIYSVTALLLFSWVGMTWAQEFRATISGRVLDPSGAGVPGVSVTVTNVDTNVDVKTLSNEQGIYTAPFLVPGNYRIVAEQPGFKKSIREGIVLKVGDKVEIDLKLEVGEVSQQITVTSDAPLLDTSNANLGQVIDVRRVQEMPLNGRMVFLLNQLSTGVIWQVPNLGASGSSGTRPFDNLGGSNWSINGGRLSTNEYLLDGAPNSVRGRWNFSPPVDAIQEFKIQTATHDAQYGRTGGGVINMLVKSGTNDLHGTLYEFLRNDKLDANSLINNTTRQKRPIHQFNQFGGTVGGPLTLPRLYQGTDRTFFFTAYEGIRERVPFPTFATVPSLLERQGNFSQTTDAQGRLITIYDPLTTREDPPGSGRYVRTPFPSNIIPPERINPAARAFLAAIPQPNKPPTNASGIENYIASPNTGKYTFNAFLVKIDHVLSADQKLFGTYYYNHRDELRNNNGFPGVALMGNYPQGRTNNGVVFDYVNTLNPKTILNLRTGWNRFTESDKQIQGTAIDRAALGFTNFPSPQATPTFPRLEFENYTTAGPGGRYNSPDNTFSLQGNTSRDLSRHYLKFGGEFRLVQANRIDTGFGSGFFRFERGFTRANPQQSDALSGNAIASLLLGYPQSGRVENPASRASTWKYYVLFIQDDFRVSPRLTINMGLRWDYEAPITERYNRLIRGFDFNATNPLNNLVDLGLIPGPGRQGLRGGLLFTGVNGLPSGAYNPDRKDWQPRLGAAYRLTDKTVLRGGYGLYFLPTTQLDFQTGFSVTTPFIASTDNGLTPANVLNNPYPTGLLPVPGSTRGLLTQVGQQIDFDDPNRVVPRIHIFSFGVQRELPGQVVADLSYVGSRTAKLGVDQDLNEISLADLNRGAADPSYLNTRVPNPFAGLLPGSGFNDPTVPRQQLLRPYPQFGRIIGHALSRGKTWYNSMQLRVEKRFSAGLTFISSYTLSKNLESVRYLSAQNTQLERTLTDFDRTHVWVFSGIYDLPWGPGRKFLAHTSGLVGRLLEGWQVDWIARFMSGLPTAMPDAYQTEQRSADLRSQQTFDRWFDTTIWVPRPPFTQRVTPSRFPDVRNPWRPNYDFSLIKRTRINERVKTELRAEFFNATNTPIFDGPNTGVTSSNFGRVTRQQINLPRNIQMALKVTW